MKKEGKQEKEKIEKKEEKGEKRKNRKKEETEEKNGTRKKGNIYNNLRQNRKELKKNEEGG